VSVVTRIASLPFANAKCRAGLTTAWSKNNRSKANHLRAVPTEVRCTGSGPGSAFSTKTQHVSTSGRSLQRNSHLTGGT